MTLKTWHSTLGILAGLAVAVMLFLDDWSAIGIVVSAALTAFFAGNFFLAWRSRAHLAESELWDLSGFKDHQDFSLAAAAELWEDEVPGSTLELPVKLKAQVSGPTEEAPLSRQKTAAWRLMIQGFRTSKLGTDGVSLLERQGFSALLLEDGADKVTVEAPGLLNLGKFREELTTWTGVARFPKVRPMAEEGLVLGGVKKDEVPGLRLRETRLDVGESVTVYGLLTRGPEGFVLKGSDQPGDPKRLLVVSDKAADKLRHRRGSWPSVANAALLVASVPLLAWSLLGTPEFLSRHDGPVWINPKGQTVVVTFQGSPTPDVWTFDETDTGSNISLKSDGADWTSDGDHVVTLTRILGTPVEYGIEKPLKPAWVKGAWRIDPAHPWTPGPHKGTLYFRNLGVKTVTLRFPDNTKLETFNWELKPHEGQSSTRGNEIVLNDEDVSFAEGQLVHLEVGEEVARRLVFGLSPELKWDAANSNWKLEISATTLKAKLQPLWASPVDAKHLRGSLAEPEDGQPITFDLPPGAGDARAVRSVVDKAYTLGEWQTLKVTEADVEVLYTGPLSLCPLVKWTGAHWLLNP